MLFDTTTKDNAISDKVCKKGDKLTLMFDGKPFPVECVGSTVIEFERKYRMRFNDGSERYMTAAELKLPN